MQQATLQGKHVLLDVDSINTTFRGGSGEPMHDWYPLLEGYSSGFVKAVLSKFANSSARVLDPFSGIGTTVLEASRLGKASFYCEVNPVLQHLTFVKFAALSMDPVRRSEFANGLSKLAERVPAAITASPKDRELEDSYHETFGDSSFFDSKNFDKVLRARSLVDLTKAEDPLLSRFLALSILSSLTPASFLIRAGDLRFRRGSELNKVRPLDEIVGEKLVLIAKDLLRLPTVKDARSNLVCEDARHLLLLPSLGIDAVVTSPPYPNGTNYFRNTKLELWFLRCLRSTQDLRWFRDRAVTAGINDVIGSKDETSVGPPELSETLQRLRDRSYDKRIPKLIGNYFSDMDKVMRGLYHHMNNGALLAIDIGDSIFAGVHITTDLILARIGENIGFSGDGMIFLRKRQSHDGSRLRQVLLLFHKKSGGSASLPGERSWELAWTDFKTRMDHQRDPFARRNWGHPIHSLCSYGGKMKPSLAHFLVKAFVPSGGRMLDPFAGVGTLPFEAAMSGARSFSFEISPAARILTLAKLGQPNSLECREVITRLDEHIRSHQPREDELNDAKSFGFNHKLGEFYHPRTLEEIVLARNYFLANEVWNTSRALVMASLLHILHGNRPYALSRRSHPITPFAPTGPFEYRPLIPRLIEKVNRHLGLEYPPSFVEGTVFDQDATSRWPSEVDQLDAIITSPPFFDSTRFYMQNWLRLWFAGWGPADFKIRPKSFLDERQKKGFDVYESVFRQARESLRPRGVMVLHLGASRKSDMAKELSTVASTWFQTRDIFVESVRHLESHGIRDKGTVTEHKYLVLD